jgi:hypothetical protein
MVTLKVVASGLNTIMEALALYIPELLGRRIPTTAIMIRVVHHGHRRSHSFAEVRNGHLITAAETVAVVVANGWGNRGMAEFISPFHIQFTMTFKVVAGGFDAIVEALALNVPELLGRCIPAAAIMVRVVLRCPVLGHEQGRSS